MNTNRPEIYIAPCVGEHPTKNLNRSVRSSIDSTVYRQYLDIDLGDSANFWVARTDNSPENGDYIFFYTDNSNKMEEGSRMYTLLGRVKEKTIESREFAEYLSTPPIGVTEEDRTIDKKSCEIIPLDPVVNIELQGSKFANILGHDRSYPLAFSPVSGGFESIREKVGSMQEFISEIKREGSESDGPSTSQPNTNRDELKIDIINILNQGRHCHLQGPMHSGLIPFAQKVAKRAVTSRLDSGEPIRKKYIEHVTTDRHLSEEVLFGEQTAVETASLSGGLLGDMMNRARNSPQERFVFLITNPNVESVTSALQPIAHQLQATSTSPQNKRTSVMIPNNLQLLITTVGPLNTEPSMVFSTLSTAEASVDYTSLLNQTEQDSLEDMLSYLYAERPDNVGSVGNLISESDEFARNLAVYSLYSLNQSLVSVTSDPLTQAGQELLYSNLDSKESIRRAWVYDIFPHVRKFTPQTANLGESLGIQDSDNLQDIPSASPHSIQVDELFRLLAEIIGIPGY